jgi:predicted outer membrane protein
MKMLIVTVAAAAALAAAAAASASAPPQDENWLQTSISGDRFEIAGGKLALARGTTPATRALGRRLMRDHAKALHEGVVLARELGVGVPPAATPSEQWELNRLRNMPRAWFDVQYASLEVRDHEQDIEETGFEAREGGLWQVRAAARKDLPMLNMHLKLSRATLSAAEDARRS